MQRQNFFSSIRFSRVLTLGLLVVIFGGLLKLEAAAQPISFGARTDFGTDNSPQSVAVGDFNGDGNPDLAVANFNSNTVSILLGLGTGSFGAKTDFGTGSGPRSVALGDFNGDGKLDLAVANDDSNLVSILLGTGTGSFGAKTDFGTGVRPQSVAVGDFNGDGKLDLAVANIVSNLVSILLGTGTGSFGAKTDFGTGSGPISVAVGDFNGDGKLDLAVANFGSSSNSVSILLGLGTGSFGAKTDFGTGGAPRSVAVGDFNGDGKLDLAVANRDSHTVSILLGTGTGSFGAKTDFGTGSLPFSVAVEDFNGDGKLDLAVANGGGNTVSILPGLGTGSFGARSDFGTGSLPISVAVEDFNGDGKLDLAVANFDGNTVSALLNNCTANTAPTLTLLAVTRTAGSPSANSQIATAMDAEDAANVLRIQISNGGPFGDAATLNGVTVTLTDQNAGAPNVNPDAMGKVFADVVAACGAMNANFTLRVTDIGGLMTDTPFTVTVNPNTPPVLSYTTQTVTAGTTPMFNPATGPSDNGSVASIVLQSVMPMTGLMLNVNSATGQATVTSASLAGSYTVVIRATDNCAPGAGTFTDATFTVNVVCPTITLAALPGGVGGTPYSQTIAASPANGGYSFMQTGGTLPNGLTLMANGLLSGTPTAAGSFSFDVKVTGFGTCMNTQTLTVVIACPAITLAALPAAAAGTAYNQTLTASPAGGNYTFILASGSLPPNLMLAANGSITGTPTTSGVYNFNVQVTGFGACMQTLPVTVSVGCPTITLSPASLPNATVNTAYPATITASPAGGGYSFAVSSGLLPAGLTLNSNGSFSGAATQSGVFNFRITVTGFGTCTGFRDYTLMVNCQAITVNPASLPGGTVGTGYSQSVSATPAGTYTYSLTSGAMPSGLSLNSSTGAITGTPAQSGTFSFIITAGAGGCTGSRSFSIAIACGSITLPRSLPAATAGVTYSASAAASPGGTYIYSLQSGALGSGLTLNTSTGAITGLPIVAGTFNFTIKATGSGDCVGTQSYSMPVSCPIITVLPATLPNGTTGTAYSQTLTAAPATGSYSFAVSSGSLPFGLNLNATGLLSGTPTTNGTYNFSVTATGFGSCASAPKSYSITIGSGGCPAITLPNIAATGTIGSPYNQSVAASPSGYYTYVLTGTTPPGVIFYNAAALLYGYPTTAGTYNFTITATDSSSCTGSKSYSVTIP